MLDDREPAGRWLHVVMLLSPTPDAGAWRMNDYDMTARTKARIIERAPRRLRQRGDERPRAAHITTFAAGSLKGTRRTSQGGRPRRIPARQGHRQGKGQHRA